eukprot:1124283-Pyramimonas_sp.AAC.1
MFRLPAGDWPSGPASRRFPSGTRATAALHSSWIRSGSLPGGGCPLGATASVGPWACAATPRPVSVLASAIRRRAPDLAAVVAGAMQLVSASLPSAFARRRAPRRKPALLVTTSAPAPCRHAFTVSRPLLVVKGFLALLPCPGSRPCWRLPLVAAPGKVIWACRAPCPGAISPLHPGRGNLARLRANRVRSALARPDEPFGYNSVLTRPDGPSGRPDG